MQQLTDTRRIGDRFTDAVSFCEMGAATIAADPMLVSLLLGAWVEATLAEVELREQDDVLVPVADTTTELLWRLMKRVDAIRSSS